MTRHRPRGWNRFLHLECLEDRVNPAFVDIGALRLDGPNFNGSVFTGGAVAVGFAPLDTNDTFRSLLEVDLGTAGTITVDNGAKPGFGIDQGTMKLVSTTGVVIPFWMTTSPVTFTSEALTTSVGQDLTGKGSPITFSRFDATVTTTAVLLLNSSTTSTADSFVGLQAALGLTGFPDLKLTVDDGNYIYARESGITLTGAEADLGSTIEGGGLTAVSAGLVVGYSDAGGKNTYTFTGQFSLSSGDGQIQSKASLGASLDLVIVDSAITQFGGSLNTEFTVAKAQFIGKNVMFNGDLTTNTFTFNGDLSVNVTPDPTDATKNQYVDIVFGTSNDPTTPGIVVTNGVLQTLNARVVANMNLFNVVFDVQDPLVFAYSKANEQFEMSGGATATFGSKAPVAFTVDFPSLGNMSGLIIRNGKIERFVVDITAQVGVAGVQLNKGGNGDFEFGYTYDTTTKTSSYTISGSAEITNVFHAQVMLGSSAASPGITIVDGEFKLDNLSIAFENVTLGVFEIQEGIIEYTTDANGETTFTVGVSVQFPGDWGVGGGEVMFIDGKINTIEIDYSAGNSNGIPIGDTGLFLNYAEITVANIENPDRPLTVSGDVAVTYGEALDLSGDGTANDYIIAGQGKFLVNDQQIAISGGVYLGATVTQRAPITDEPTFAGLLGSGTGHITIDWAAKVYSAGFDFQLLDGLFEVKADFTFRGTANDYTIFMSAEADIEVPKFIPVIGGLKLASADFVLDFRDVDGMKTGFFAGWVDLFDNLLVAGVKYDFLTRTWSLIGRQGVDAVIDCEMNPEACITGAGPYTYSNQFVVPAGATGVTISVEWPENTGTTSLELKLPSGAIIPQSALNSGNYSLKSVPGQPTMRKLEIVGAASNDFALLAAGTYEVRLTSTAKYNGTVDFTAGLRYPPPLVSAPQAINDATNGNLVNVTLTGSVNKNFINNVQARLFIVPAPAGAPPAFTPSAKPVPLTPQNVVFTPGTVDPTTNQQPYTITAQLDLSDRIFQTYFVYALLDDGVHVPVASGNSVNPVTNAAPINGQFVSTITSGPVDGITVYVDANHSGTYEPSDPHGISNVNGGFTISDPNGDLTVGTTYQLALVLPPGVTLDASSSTKNPQSFVYTATRQSFDYLLDLTTGASGTVFQDYNQNGQFDAGDPVAQGVLVFVDVNNNGTLDAGEPQTLSLADGSWHIYGLTPGSTVTIRSAPANPFYATSPTVQTVTLPTSPSGQSTGLDFGVLSLQTISGTVKQHTRDASGNLSPTATAQSGVVVTLTKAGSTPITTTTDKNGFYSFSVPVGTYTITESINTSQYRQLSPFTGVLNMPNSPFQLNLGFQPWSVAAGDIDQDGFIDLVITQPTTLNGVENPNAYVMWGSADGSFDNGANRTYIGNMLGLNVALADTTGTGKLDILFWNTGQQMGIVILLPNTGNRSFGPAQSQGQFSQNAIFNDLAVGDFNGNGTDDYVYTVEPNFVLANFFAKPNNFSTDANTRKNTSPPLNGLQGQGLASVIDLDNDGTVELVIAAQGNDNANNYLSVGTFDQYGNFTLTSDSIPLSSNYAFGDIDFDGINDLLFFNLSTNQLEIRHGNGDKTFSPVPNSTTWSLPANLQNLNTYLVDLNGDLRPELVAFTQAAGRLAYIWENTGVAPYYAANPTAVLGFSPENFQVSGSAIADVNNDGLADVINVDGNDNNLYVFYNQSKINNGSVTLTLVPGTLPVGVNFVNAELGSVSGAIYDDVNRNGVRDAADTGLVGVSVYLDQNGNNRFDVGEPRTQTVFGGAYSFAASGGRVGVLSLESHHIPPGSIEVVQGVVKDIMLARRWLTPVVPHVATVGQSLTFTVVPSGQAADRSLKFELLEGPAGATMNAITGQVTWLPSSTGTARFVVKYVDHRSPLQKETLTFSLPLFEALSTNVPTPVTLPTFNSFPNSRENPIVLTATAAGAGWVRVYDHTHGVERFRFQPFGDFFGGVRLALADLDGDTIADIITAAGPGGGPHVKIYSGATGELLQSAFVFDSSFRGGIFVSAGDLDGDGVAEIVITPDRGGGPVVAVYDATLKNITNFLAFEPEFRGGLRSAMGDVNADGIADIIVTAGAGGAPRVAGFNGANLPQRLFGDFLALDSRLRTGFTLTAGDIDGDGFADLFLGYGLGGGPRVDLYSGKSLSEGRPNVVRSFFVGASDNRSGAKLAARDLDGDGRAELLAAEGHGVGPVTTVWDPRTPHRLDAWFAHDPLAIHGVEVG